MRRFAKVERILPKVLFVCALLYWLTCSTFAESGTAQSGIEEMLHRAAQEGKLAYKLTTPEELKVLLGSEGKETIRNDGGMVILDTRFIKE